MLTLTVPRLHPFTYYNDMAKNGPGPSEQRARRTLYVTGFNSKVTSKRLLEELFTQGGPVRDIIMFDTHAYVAFHDEESVAYCLALFNEVELHGQKLRLNSRVKTRDTYKQMNYLKSVRQKLMEEYNKLPPPNLPPKQMSSVKTSRNKDSSRSPLKKGNGKNGRKQNRSNNNINKSLNTTRRHNNSDKDQSSHPKTKANKVRKVRKHRPKSKSRAKRK